MWTMTLWDQSMPPIQWGVAIGASLAGAVSDLGTRRVPNRLTGPVLLGGLVWAALIGRLAGLADATAGCLMLAFPYVLLFVFFGGGAGDAKLMGALGAWLGVINGTVVLASVLLSGLVLAVGFALAKKQLVSVLVNVARMVTLTAIFPMVVGAKTSRSKDLVPRTQDMQKIPYAIAIFAGVCFGAGGVFLWRVQ